ncbi:MAG: hypothetical protein GY953_53330 [bacterium]|nr:hypothetical protein [bacterium]
MRVNLRLPTAGLLLATTLAAQTLQVYSEFRRVDPFGEIVASDSEGRPREILSPLLARGAHATFHLVVTAPQGKIYYLYVSANPEHAVDVTLYKAMFSKHDGAWIPDRLLEVKSPYTSHVPDRYHGIPNQTAEVFVIDLWVPSNANPGRMKLDAQLGVDDRWLTYPMEIRISDIVAPLVLTTHRALAPTTAPSDTTILSPLREYLCREPEKGRKGPPSIRQFIRRNTLEDIAIARNREDELGADGAANALLRGLNIDRPTFCASAGVHSERYGPEWFLRARDLLHKGIIDYY